MAMLADSGGGGGRRLVSPIGMIDSAAKATAIIGAADVSMSMKESVSEPRPRPTI